MIRRQARLRREYIYRKSVEQKERTIQEKKRIFKKAVDDNRPIPTELRKDVTMLENAIEWQDDGIAERQAVDDEYRWAGVDDPKLVITTSRDPSAKLKQFAKEMRLIFPNSQRVNRGRYEMKQLLEACRAEGASDFLIVTEHRGVADGIVICHLPFGPTAFFSLSNVVMRHDIPDVGHAPEQYPHLIFNNFSTNLGKRVVNILKYLFPVPKDDSKRVTTFSNQQDFISFRQHSYRRGEHGEPELSEIGPRFEMKLYEIKLGTLDALNAADTEWAFRPFMNTTKKRTFL